MADQGARSDFTAAAQSGGGLLRLNLGCGYTPTPGWRNFDNSFSVRLGRAPSFVPAALKALRLISEESLRLAGVARAQGIRCADVTRLPLADASAEVIYCSHVLEHMPVTAAETALRDMRRVLAPGGYLRIAVPDLANYVRDYSQTGDADTFMERLCTYADNPRGLLAKTRQAVFGYRGHLWLYDTASMARRIAAAGFKDVTPLQPGETTIPNPGPLNLAERADDSLYIEARRP